MPDPDLFSLPVLEFVTQVMREKFPNMNISRGGAFYQSFIKPAAFMLQPFRDRTNVIKRNQSLSNYQVMSDEEMDRRAADFVIDRKDGTYSFGTQRVFYDEVRAVYIDNGAVFFDDSDHRWSPIDGVVMSEIEMSSNLIPETGEYFVDVAVIAEKEGSEYKAEAGQVNQFSGVPGATRTLNPSDFSEALNIETNTELFSRITESITNRDLVKDEAISVAIIEAFDSVRTATSIGFGDPDMERDVVEAVVAVDQILQYSFCQKVNLPLDENGEVSWKDSSGNPIVVPLGGWVAAVTDMTGIDYHAVPLSAGKDYSTPVSVQPGFQVRMYTAYNGDPDGGDYTVSRVEFVPIEINGALTQVLRLDRAFADPQISSWNPVTDLDKYSYSVLGAVVTKHFHVGGKIDTYVDSTADEEDTVIVGVLPETAPGVTELPITSLIPINPDTGLPLFENGNGFRIPVVSILKIEQIDFENEDEIERELIPDINYVYVSAESRGRFTRAENDVLIIKGFEEDDVTPAFVGRRIKITYLTNPDIPLIQAFVDSRKRKDLSKNILIKPSDTAIVDVEFSFEGPLTLANAKTIVGEYIKSQGFGATLNASDISALMLLYGATKVHYPIQMRLRRDLGNGLTESASSTDSLTANSTEVFYPDTDLSITST